MIMTFFNQVTLLQTHEEKKERQKHVGEIHCIYNFIYNGVLMFIFSISYLAEQTEPFHFFPLII